MSDAEHLEPANERPATLLPPLHVTAGSTTSAGGAIRAVYAHGIEFIDQMGTIGGMLAGFMWSGALLWAGMLVWTIREVPDFYLLHSVLGLAFVLCLGLGRADSVGFRYEPVLFNKALQKVHVFSDLGGRWWEIWKPFGGTSFRIDTYDWACARGEVAEVLVMGGASMPRKEYVLTLAITDRPGSDKVVARFGVGPTTGYDRGAAQVARWEHIRRYMKNEGPAVTPGDTLFVDASRDHWISALTFGQPLLGPGSKVWWTGEGWHGAWFVTIPFGVAFLFLLPLTVPFSLIRWAVQRFKSEPRWPAEILSSVGGAIDPSQFGVRPNAAYAAGNYDETMQAAVPLKQRRLQAKQRKQGSR